MESEDEKRIRLFAESKKRFEETMAANKKFFDELKKNLAPLFKETRKNEQAEEQNYLNYFNAIQAKIFELKESTEICRYLLSEKRKYGAKIVETNITRNGYNRKFYQKGIDEIIEPILKHWEKNLEYEKINSQIIPNTSDLKEQNNVSNQSPNEIIITESETKTIIPDTIKTDPKLPEGFQQIKCKATEDEILNFFMILSKVKNKEMDEFYMKEEDVLEFVKKNFSVFNATATGKYFPINLGIKQKGRLMDFMNKFYRKYDYDMDNKKIKYARLLIYNFDQFKNDDPQVLLSNMSPSKSPIEKNTIPVTFFGA